MTRRVFAIAVAFVTMSLGACDKKTPTGKPASPDSQDPTKVAIGQQLADAPYPAPSEGAASADAVVIPFSHVVVLQKSDLSSPLDGRVNFVGVPVSRDQFDKLPVNQRFEHPRTKLLYRQVQPGDQLEANAPVVFLEDDQAAIEFMAAEIKQDTSNNIVKAFNETIKQLRNLVAQTEDAMRRGVGTTQDLYNQQATLARYLADLSEKIGSVKIAEAELKQKKYMLDRHIVNTSIAGLVQQVLKQRGEGTKATEPILTLVSLDRLRVVGNLPKEYLQSVRPGDKVTIELPRDVPPGVPFDKHTTGRAITAVAVAVVGGKPLIVSGAEDGRTFVWDRDRKVVADWLQSAAVRAVAVTRPGADKALAFVGSDNGVGRVYDLSNPGREPLRELDTKLDGPVTAAAFSPDGKHLVTADERGIYMNDVDTGKRKYAFPSRVHHSAITALHYTPQGRVVSIGREPAVRVWVAGDTGARLEHQHGLDRTGDVPALGVTDDGARLLLDADRNQLDVIHLQSIRKERPLATGGEGSRFQTFALWSPALDGKADNRLIATTGGAEGVVQLWRAPTADVRGAEIARLFTPGSAPATCAAFSPTAADGFIVVGTRRGNVQLWSLPGSTDVQREIEATVTHVEPVLESSGRSANVMVDFTNPKVDNRPLLRPGTAVTLVIRPGK